MKKNSKTEFFEAIEILAKSNQLSFDEVKEILAESIIKSFHTKFDPDAELEIIIDREKDVFELINNSKRVVEDEEDGISIDIRPIEIELKDALKIDKNVKVGDDISEKIDFELYSRSNALQIKQLLMQKVREKKKEVIYSKHKSLLGEMISVTVESVAANFAIFKLEDGITAFMPRKFMTTSIQYKIGQRVDVYVEEVLEESKDAQIIVSNSSKALIARILEDEVPEIKDGTIEVMGMARLPGQKTKVVLMSNDANVDPVGTVIGSRGSRIRSINEKMGSEKIELVKYSPIKHEYIVNALTPAKVISLVKKEDGENQDKFIAIVPGTQKTLAIGRFGSNVRLVSELLGIGIDILSEEEAKEKGIEFE
jgi:N utilization substance protein A